MASETPDNASALADICQNEQSSVNTLYLNL